MASIYFGMCHTFTYENRENTDTSTKSFVLDPTLNYRIMIHDPKFYHLFIKIMFPRIFLQYRAGRDLDAGTFDYYDITVTEHQLINRPEQSCEEDEDYDFLECVKTSQARMVGCRPPWDIWSPHTIPLCQTVDQLKHHERLDWVDVNLEQKMIVNNTNCRLPCHYREYKAGWTNHSH